MTRDAVLYFDGCSKGNPGPSGCGCIIKYNDMEWSGSEYLGNTTNNVAEYKGMLLGLSQLKRLNINKVIVKGDSMLVINHMTGNYKVKSPQLMPLYNEAKEIIKDIRDIRDIQIDFLYIPREQNKEADYLANDGLKQHFNKTLFEFS
jgi:ribonuclease HI